MVKIDVIDSKHGRTANICAGHQQQLLPSSMVSGDSGANLLDNLLSSSKAGKFGIVSLSELLSQANLESVSVGNEESSMSVVSKDMNVSDVCRSFGSLSGSKWMTALDGKP